MGDGIPAFRLHHHAYVVDDQEATRAFYEDLLGFPLVATRCEGNGAGERTNLLSHVLRA